MSKWDEWCNVWCCVGWHALACRSNFGVPELLDMIVGLMYRVRRLEMSQPPNPFAFLAGL